ncbi:hypothetical protein PAHAL_2G039600 [Panicum hallii]|jgi:hypothetical protein|uniref:Uncharacterized protein n=1 Tax=Panicum hallii TaxID=206008 RepID=A0A2T8KMS0_9POAL|nr:hypothetical protein PAHAL_2G039600 [Panicum hallii]
MANCPRLPPALTRISLPLPRQVQRVRPRSPPAAVPEAGAASGRGGGMRRWPGAATPRHVTRRRSLSSGVPGGASRPPSRRSPARRCTTSTRTSSAMSAVQVSSLSWHVRGSPRWPAMRRAQARGRSGGLPDAGRAGGCWLHRVWPCGEHAGRPHDGNLKVKGER